MGLLFVLVMMGVGIYFLKLVWDYVSIFGLKLNGTSVLLIILSVLIFCLEIFLIWVLAIASRML